MAKEPLPDRFTVELTGEFVLENARGFFKQRPKLEALNLDEFVDVTNLDLKGKIRKNGQNANVRIQEDSFSDEKREKMEADGANVAVGEFSIDEGTVEIGLLADKGTIEKLLFALRGSDKPRIECTIGKHFESGGGVINYFSIRLPCGEIEEY